MDKLLATLKKQFDKEPLQTLAVGGLFIGAVAKLWDARTNAARSKVWAREEARRERKDRGGRR